MLSRAESRLLHALKRRKARAEQGLFLAEGVRVTEAALEAGIDLRLAVVSTSLEDTPRGRELAIALERRGPVRRVSDAELERLAETESPQGVLAIGAIPQADAALRPGPRDTLLVLDGVQDPGNFGALVRSADALGARAVLALTGTVDPWNPKAVRAAAGSTFHVPIVQLSAGSAVEWLRARDIALYAAHAAGEPVERVELVHPCALVVGNEGAGVGEVLSAAARATVGVPIRGGAESLNVAVAAGILLYLMAGGAADDS